MTSGYFYIDIKSNSKLEIESLEELKVELIYHIKHLHNIDPNIMNLFIGKDAEYLKISKGRLSLKSGTGTLLVDYHDSFMKVIISIFYLIDNKYWDVYSNACWYFDNCKRVKKIGIEFTPLRPIPVVKFRETKSSLMSNLK